MRKETFQCEKQVFRDERTGHDVWRLTNWENSHCVAPYVYFQAFSRDEKYLVFLSDRSGRWELYRLEIENGKATQITDYSDSSLPAPFLSAANFHPEGNELFFIDGRTLCAANIETLTLRTVVEPPAGWKGNFNGPCFSRDGRHVFTCFVDAKQRINIVCIEHQTGAMEVVYRWPHPAGQGVDVNHLQCAPTDELILTFSPLPDRQNDPDETPEHRARSWKLDVATGKAEPFLVMPQGFRATHEHWGTTAGGEPRLYCHKKTVPTWTPTSLASVSLAGDDFQEHYTSQDRKLGHSCLSPDGCTLVADVQDPDGNELIVVDLASGAAEVLCWPDSSATSGPVQVGHVHPSFSPSGKKIVFTSDEGGKAAVYVVPMTKT